MVALALTHTPGGSHRLTALSFLGTLFPVFQPIVPLPWNMTENPCDVIYEMLARVRTKEGLILLPGEFLGSRIPHAEVDTGMLELVPAIQAAHPKAHFSINASPVSLCNDHYFALLLSMLKSGELNAEHLILEITEDPGDSLMDVEVMDRAEIVRDLGVRLALDDFGSGGNGIARLACGHFDLLKISPAIDLNTVRGRTIIEGMIQMVGSLSGIGTGSVILVVEGIETPEQLEQAMFINAHYGQGHIISPPVEDIVPAQKLRNRVNWVSSEHIRIVQ